MPTLTFITRLRDGLPLAESIGDEKDHRDFDTYKSQAKQLFIKLRSSAEGSQSFESGGCIVANGVLYLTLCEKGYPRKLAFSYLKELQREFEAKHLRELDKPTRPYPFIKFDKIINERNQEYGNTRTQRNLTRLNDDLSEIHNIMTRNISDVLERGTKLGEAQQIASSLVSDSRGFLAQSKRLDMLTLWRAYAPYVIVVIVILVVLGIRFMW